MSDSPKDSPFQELAQEARAIADDLGKLASELKRAQASGVRWYVPITRTLSDVEKIKLTTHYDAELGAGTWGIMKVPVTIVTPDGRLEEVPDPPQSDTVQEIMACRCEACLAVTIS